MHPSDSPPILPLSLPGLVAGHGSLEPLFDSAHAFDRLDPFVEAVRAWRLPDAHSVGIEGPCPALVRAILEEARHTEALADSADITDTPPALPDAPSALRPVLGGQQAYIDYTPGVLAKLDALDAVNAADPACLGWYGLIEYDAFGSDRPISRTELPRAEPLGDRRPLLSLQIHPGARRWRHHDMRRVPPPERAWLEKQVDALGAQLAYAGRRLPGFDRSPAFARLRRLAADYEHARVRARNVADFNSVFSVRQFRRLGFRAPCVRLGELMAALIDDDTVRPRLATVLADLVHRRPEIEATIRETVDRARGFDLLMGPERARPFPLRWTEPTSGLRLPLRLERRGVDHRLSADGSDALEIDLGAAGPSELEELLHTHGRALSFDVFLPVFLFRLGLAGLVNGKGSLRYSLVLARLLETLYGHHHPPNLLVAGRCPAASSAVDSPLVAAIRQRRPDLPPEVEALETTLVGASLSLEPDELRALVGRVWHDGPGERVR